MFDCVYVHVCSPDWLTQCLYVYIQCNCLTVSVFVFVSILID